MIDPACYLSKIGSSVLSDIKETNASMVTCVNDKECEMCFPIKVYIIVSALSNHYYSYFHLRYYQLAGVFIKIHGSFHVFLFNLCDVLSVFSLSLTSCGALNLL
jgi:hypothetical protein